MGACTGSSSTSPTASGRPKESLWREVLPEPAEPGVDLFWARLVPYQIQTRAGEDIEVATLSEEELRAAISSGEIRHALVLTALHRIFDLRTELGPRT